jgi:quinoprotein glucose dehydrogenase
VRTRSCFRPHLRLGAGIFAITGLLACAAAAGGSRPSPDAGEWRVYGGDPASRRYSALDQIHRGNVHRLRVAWVYHTGDHDAENRSQIQANPIVVDGVLYSTSPALRVFALRAATGEELWKFDPFQDAKREEHASRGVVYWEEGGDRRILFTAGSRLHALDARTGRPIPTFGQGGSVDLREGLGRDTAGLPVIATTPGIVHRDLLIQGTRVSEGENGAPGHIRAYDVRTGALRWTFHTIPHPDEYGHDTWPADAWRTSGGANAWAGFSLDAERGIVYAPTGSPSFDFYGGDRKGENLFGNSVLALDAATGRRIWHFQAVRHDLWDRDLPAPPTLVTVTHRGKRVDAVAQVTKSGHVFLLERGTGRPLFPVEERPVPPSDLEGEEAWPTQPFPVKPAPFARQRLTESDLTDLSPEAHAAVRERFRKLRSGGQFVPPSVEGTVVFPGFDGGAEWGGAAFDPATGLLYVNANEMPWIAAMVKKEPSPGAAAAQSGREVYAASCAGCHGADRRGDGGRTPSLVGIGERRPAEEIREVVARGKGFMPSFAHLPAEAREAVVAYLQGVEEGGASPHAAEPRQTRPAGRVPYRFAGYHRFLDPSGYPAVKPPWGTLNAIDLNTGEIAWQVPLGEFPELTARGIPPTGTENYGGPVVTAGGVVFIGATRDEKIRAFDKATGRVLWEASLPAGGYATPSTYRASGRQFVVIAAGGGRGTQSGDAYVAFALPE